MTKLTLSMEKSVVRQAKQLAKARKTSVSAMVSDFVRSASLHTLPRQKLSPVVRSVAGIAKLPTDKTDRELLEEALMEKYGIKE